VSIFFSTVVAAATVSAALLAEHLALWHRPFRLNRVAAFVVGTFTISGGFSLWAYAADTTIVLGPYWTITASGGIAVIIAYWIRRATQCIHRRGLRTGRLVATPLYQWSRGQNADNGAEKTPFPDE
jgi:hypothetical protein